MLVVCDRLSELIDVIEDDTAAGPFDPTVLRTTEKAHPLA